MIAIQFEWDEPKNNSNQNKHGVSFEEAASSFSDPWARIIQDPDHSLEEDRFIHLGMSMKPRLLIVCHCYRGDGDEIIRIISARSATKMEAANYRKHRR